MISGWRNWVPSFGVCLMVAGCAAQSVRATYAEEFACNEEVEVDELGSGRYRVTGCMRTATYICIRSGACTLEQVSESSYPPSDKAPPKVSAVSSPPVGSSAGELDGAHLEKSKSGSQVVVLELRLDSATLLKLRGSAAAKKSVALELLRLRDEEPKTDCQLAAMINGQRVALANTEQKQLAGEATDGRTLSTLRSELSPMLVRELAVARQFAIKACKSRWSVSEVGVAELRHFAQLYQEEQAWDGPTSETGSGGLMAPAGGWPAWTASAKVPAAATGAALDAPALFKLVSPSVFKVVAVTSDGTSQGSAVAVSTSELLTNCHVLEGAQSVTLYQGKLSRPAQIARANPSADRCVLAVSEPNLKPVRGVREYADLQIGEPLFTLGSPSGLELTLANGLLSGKREEGTLNYVQTTAPISPGSSGGGLFDGRGNLVGITTLVWAGRERLNQSLNFAIPAQAFWQP